jgi:O-antigen/teichoic acid export membrane protein
LKPGFSSSEQAGAPSSAALFRNVLHGSGLYSISLVGQRVIGVALLTITTRFLAPADYGVLDLIEQVGSVLSLLLGASFSSALGYFYFQTESDLERRRVVTTTVLGALAIGAAAGALCWPFASSLSRVVFGTEAVAYSLYLVFLTMPPTFLLEGLLAWLRVENRPRMWLVGSLLRLGVTAAGVVFYVAVMRLRVVGVQYAAYLAALLPAIVLSVYCFRRNRPAFDWAVFLHMAKFAAPLGLSGIAMFVINFGDRFILRRYVTFAELGLYALAYKIGLLINAIYASFQIYWSSQVYAIMKREDADAVFARIFTYMALGVGYCGLGIVLCSKPALRLLTAPAYHGAVRLIPLLVMAYCVRCIGEFFRCLFMVEGKPGYDAACTWIASSVCLGGYFLLIPRYGVWGAAAATAITFILFAAVAAVWTHRLRPYRVEGARLAKIGVALLAGGVPYALFPMEALAAQIGWAILLAAVFPAALWALRFATPGESKAISSATRTVARRFHGSVPAAS